MTLLKILFLEDRPEDVELTLFELRLAGYNADWKRVDTQKDYVASLDPALDLILADYSLPQFTALNALHLLQERQLDIPFIVVTGSIEEAAIECMKQGASDYLLKDRLGRLGPAIESALQQKRLRAEKRQAEEALQRAHRNLAEAYEETLRGWSKAMDLHDHELEGHSERVTAMTLKLAAAMGMPEEQIKYIQRGALLHDIGKIAVPDAILQKPGPLSEEDWVIMRKHPLYALEMLAAISYLRPSLDIPYAHHERWDGSGYPRGLKGEEIPLAARIFAIIDVWDALLYARVYHPAWEIPKLKEYILSQSGRQFDPRVVEKFFELLNRGEFDRK